MRIRGFILLGLAVLFATVSVVLARAWLERQGTAALAISVPEAVELVPVVVAAADLSYGDVVRPVHLRVVPWPRRTVPAQAFTEIAAVTETGDGTPRIALRDIVAGEPVLSGKISGTVGSPTLASRIAPGKRAVTVPVTGTQGVGGFVRPDDRVDVLLTRTRSAGANTGQRPVDVLLLNARILATDRSEAAGAARRSTTRTVTLEVDPEEAQKLALAETLGSLSLALRHVPVGAEGDPLPARSVTLDDLIATMAAAGRKAPASPTAAPSPQPASHVPTPIRSAVRVFRGLEAADYKVDREATNQQHGAGRK